MSPRGKEVLLHEYGNVLGPRVLGEKIRQDVITVLEKEESEFVVFSLKGVTSLSSGFSHELFGKLWLQYGENFGRKIKFNFGDEPGQSTIKIIINSAIELAMNQSRLK